MRRGFEEKSRLVKAVAKCDLDSDEGDATFRLFARHAKIQDALNKISFQVTAKDNRITGAEKRPLFGDSAQSSCIDSFQVRYTDFDRRAAFILASCFGPAVALCAG